MSPLLYLSLWCTPIVRGTDTSTLNVGWAQYAKALANHGMDKLVIPTTRLVEGLCKIVSDGGLSLFISRVVLVQKLIVNERDL